MIMSPKALREQTHLPQSLLLIPEHIKVKYVRRPNPVAQSCRAFLPDKCRRISAWKQPSLCHDRGMSATPAGTVTECTCRSAGTAVDEGFVASESEVSQTFFSQYCGILSNKLTNVRLASKPSLFTTTRPWACMKH